MHRGSEPPFLLCGWVADWIVVSFFFLWWGSMWYCYGVYIKGEMKLPNTLTNNTNPNGNASPSM